MIPHKPSLHFFLSYSREDQAFVSRLRENLESRQIPTWIDTEGLTPGTSNWERALRHALSHSFGVVVIASPSACDSTFVQAELALAKSLDLPTIPVWSRGDSWIQSVPLAAAQTQYIDLREGHYAANWEDLVLLLRETITARKPRYVLITDAYAGWYDNKNEESFGWGVSSYLTIQLGEPPYNKPSDERLREEEAVLFNPDAYDSLQALLDDLYAEFLNMRFPASTYGSRWILEERSQRRFDYFGIHPNGYLFLATGSLTNQVKPFLIETRTGRVCR